VKRAILADSTPLYAIADKSDAHHDRALEEMHALSRDRRQVLLAYPILLEVYTLILFRMGPNAALRWLSQLASSVFVNPLPGDYRQAVDQIRVFPDQAITLVDATLAAVATRLGLQVWTYDHHFDVMRVPVWR
jgi:predicted nucleic acid-binding protein